MIEVIEINRYFDNGWHVTYKWWVSGECACSAEKIRRSFAAEPNRDDLINAI